MDKRALFLISAMAVALTACVHGNNSTNATASTAFQARYAPLSGVGPFPNDLYFNGSTTGTLNIPFASSSAAAAPANAALASMNHLERLRDTIGNQCILYRTPESGQLECQRRASVQGAVESAN